MTKEKSKLMREGRTLLSRPDTVPDTFTLYRGWDEHLVSELVQRSTDSDIMQWTPRDHREHPRQLLPAQGQAQSRAGARRRTRIRQLTATRGWGKLDDRN